MLESFLSYFSESCVFLTHVDELSLSLTHALLHRVWHPQAAKDCVG